MALRAGAPHLPWGETWTQWDWSFVYKNGRDRAFWVKRIREKLRDMVYVRRFCKIPVLFVINMTIKSIKCLCCKWLKFGPHTMCVGCRRESCWLAASWKGASLVRWWTSLWSQWTPSSPVLPRMGGKERGKHLCNTYFVLGFSVISNIFLVTSPIQSFLQQNMVLFGTCSRWGSVPVLLPVWLPSPHG